MEEKSRSVFTLFILWKFIGSVATIDDSNGCAVTLCGRNVQSVILCEDSDILITNVVNYTQSKTGLTERTPFHNFRRMCMGKGNRCDTSNHCPDFRLKVSYLCISEFSIENICSQEPRNLTSPSMFIQSPGYPATVWRQCSWKIFVPEDHYVKITIHDLETTDGTRCNTGIKLQTTRHCVNYTLPSNVICNANNLGPLVACGSVSVKLVPSEEGTAKVRFWMSYQVRTLNDNPEANYIQNLATGCPAGAYDKISLPIDPSNVEGIIQPEEKTVSEIGTNITVVERKEIVQTDRTERTVFYIAVAVAAISLTGLIIVTVVCIRRQRLLKAAGVINGNRMQGRIQNTTANRPLPPIFKAKPKHNGYIQERPSLQDGYSRVADEILYNASQDSTRSPAYAEVDDKLSPETGRHVFRFGIHGNGRKQSIRSVENVYSELNDAHLKEVYYEIKEDNYVQQQSPGLTSTDHDQLIKDAKMAHKTTHSNDPASEKNNRPTSFEGPYTYCEMSGNARTVSKDLSDSDGSLVLMDNEVYDSYQSAHV